MAWGFETQQRLMWTKATGLSEGVVLLCGGGGGVRVVGCFKGLKGLGF